MNMRDPRDATCADATTLARSKVAVIGRSVRRLEDGPLVRGEGSFAADVNFPHQLHMRVVRSQIAHGHIIVADMRSDDIACQRDKRFFHIDFQILHKYLADIVQLAPISGPWRTIAILATGLLCVFATLR